MSGGISFEVELQSCRFRDPTRDFEPVEKVTQIRTDPLTGRRSRVLEMDFQPQRPDVEAMVERSRDAFNPFAAERREEATPTFLEDVEGIGGGRLSRGEALVVPNLFPYDRYSAVTIVSEADFVPLGGFTEGLLADAFAADLEYLRRVSAADGSTRHYSVNWNYMPLAGGSLVHPHHQLIASPVPTNYLTDVEAGLGRYGGPYFSDLAAAEEEGEERWVGREGGVPWMTGFAPMGHIDFLGVFGGRRSLFDLTDEDVGDLSRSLLRVFEHLDEMGFASFNFALYGLEGAEHFEVHCRLSPRFLLDNALGSSDVNYFEVSHGESLAFFYPEAAARDLRAKFR